MSVEYSIPNSLRPGKGRSVIAVPHDYCVVDVETTGLSPHYDNIIEIGAVRYVDFKEAERFLTFVKLPVGKSIDPFIERLTGITNEMLADAPEAAEAMKAFDSFLGDDIIVGYNVGFDVNFLYDSYVDQLGKPLSNNHVNLIRFAHKLLPDMESYSLGDVARALNVKPVGAHRAMADVLTTQECYIKMCAMVREQYDSDDDFARAFVRHRVREGQRGVRAADIEADLTKVDEDSPLYNRRCVFTGKLEKFVRKEAMQIVADLGGINEDTVTKKTNYLVLGNNDYCSSIKDGKSSKQKKAESYKLKGCDIEIIPETVFYDMIGDSLTE